MKEKQWKDFPMIMLKQKLLKDILEGEDLGSIFHILYVFMKISCEENNLNKEMILDDFQWILFEGKRKEDNETT